MRFSQIISETTAGATASGSIAPTESAFGSTQTRGASIYGDKKVGSLLKGKKTNKPYANSISEGKKVEEAKLEEEDKIIPVGKGKKLKTGLHGKADEPKFKGFKAPFRAHGVFVADKRGNKVCDCENDKLAQQVAKALTAFAIANEANIQGAGALAGGLQYEDQDPNEYDMEGDFVKNQIHTIIRVMTHLEKEIGPNDNLPEWVQMKISQAQGMLVSVMNYMISEKEKNVEKDTGIEGVTSEGKKVDRMVQHIKKSEMKTGKSADKAEDIAWATVNKRGYLDNKNKKKGK